MGIFRYLSNRLKNIIHYEAQMLSNPMLLHRAIPCLKENHDLNIRHCLCLHEDFTRMQSSKIDENSHSYINGLECEQETIDHSYCFPVLLDSLLF